MRVKRDFQLEHHDEAKISRREMLKRSAELGLLGLFSTKKLWSEGGMALDGVKLPEWAVNEIRDGVACYRVWRGTCQERTLSRVPGLLGDGEVCLPSIVTAVRPSGRSAGCIELEAGLAREPRAGRALFEGQVREKRR